MLAALRTLSGWNRHIGVLKFEAIRANLWQPLLLQIASNSNAQVEHKKGSRRPLLVNSSGPEFNSKTSTTSAHKQKGHFFCSKSTKIVNNNKTGHAGADGNWQLATEEEQQIFRLRLTNVTQSIVALGRRIRRDGIDRAGGETSDYLANWPVDWFWLCPAVRLSNEVLLLLLVSFVKEACQHAL